MISWKLPSVLGILVLAACSGGAGGGAPSTLPNSTLVPGTSNLTATGTLTIQPSGSTMSGVRALRPKYISAATTFATLFIDGATTGTRQACSSTAACTFNWTSTSGQHMFTIETDNSATLAGGGKVLSEGQQSYSLNPGANALGNMTLDGVIGNIILDQEAVFPAGSSICTMNGTFLNFNACLDGTYGYTDASGNIITLPGSFAQNFYPAVSTNNALLEISTPTTPDDAAPQPAENAYFIYLACNNIGPFTFTITVSAAPSSSNPWPSQILSAGELSAYSLTIPTVTATGFPQYSCDSSGNIAIVGPANGTIGVESKNH